jgi:hypothetical protein
VPYSSAADSAPLRVTDLGQAAPLLRAGRFALDVLALFVFSVFGLFALFLGMFAVFTGLVSVLAEIFYLAGWASAADALATGSEFPSLSIAGASFFLLLALALAAAALLLARTPRVAGIAATLLLTLLFSLGMWIASGDYAEDSSTLARVVLSDLFIYGTAAAAISSSLLLTAAIAVRRRSPVGRIVQGWPPFAIGLFTARYGVGYASFWRRVLRIVARLLLVIAAIAVAFMATIFAGGVLAAQILPLLGVSKDWLPMLFFMDILLWTAVALTSTFSAVRSEATRLADALIAAFAIVVAVDMSLIFAENIEFTRAFSALGVTAISEAELQFLNLVPLVWLFRSLVSRQLLRAYEALRRSTARTARELADRRPEPPILFLRSFMDDEQLVSSSDALLGYAFGAGRSQVRLEEIVAGVMFARGPLVALANPHAHSAPIGAARDVTADADWQEKVLSYLAASQIVVCFLGKTQSFLWEIDRIIAEGKLDASLIVLPPSYPHDRQLVHDAPMLARLIGLRDEADERARLAGVRVIVHDAAENGFRAVRSRHADSFSYREAILIGAATILQNARSRETKTPQKFRSVLP